MIDKSPYKATKDAVSPYLWESLAENKFYCSKFIDFQKLQEQNHKFIPPNSYYSTSYYLQQNITKFNRTWLRSTSAKGITSFWILILNQRYINRNLFFTCQIFQKCFSADIVWIEPVLNIFVHPLYLPSKALLFKHQEQNTAPPPLRFVING